MDPTITRSENDALRAILAAGQNAYGITIGVELDRITGERHNVGALYAMLGRLDRKGFVTSSWGEPTAERGGRRKRYYSITALGQRALHSEGSRLGAAGFDWKILEPPTVTS